MDFTPATSKEKDTSKPLQFDVKQYIPRRNAKRLLGLSCGKYLNID